MTPSKRIACLANSRKLVGGASLGGSGVNGEDGTVLTIGHSNHPLEAFMESLSRRRRVPDRLRSHPGFCVQSERWR